MSKTNRQEPLDGKPVLNASLLTAIEEGGRLVISPAVSWNEANTGGELALYHLETGRYFGLNSMAANVWRLIASGATAAEIVTQLAQRYDAPPADIASEVRRLLVELVQAGLLVKVLLTTEAVRS